MITVSDLTKMPTTGQKVRYDSGNPEHSGEYHVVGYSGKKSAGEKTRIMRMVDVKHGKTLADCPVDDDYHVYGKPFIKNSTTIIVRDSKGVYNPFLKLVEETQ